MQLGYRSSGLSACIAVMAAAVMGCGDNGQQVNEEAAPRILSTTILDVDHTNALVAARIHPTDNGADCWCAYGSDHSTGDSAFGAVLEGSVTPIEVTARLEGLQPATRYYFRWKAASLAAVVTSALDSLLTQPPNDPPDTFLNTAPLDTLQGILRLRASWEGSDSDGTIVGFEIQVSDSGTETPWMFTAKRDSLFLVDLGIDGLYRLRVRAMDDDRAVDPTPAYVNLGRPRP